MLHDIFIAFWFFLPAAFANMTPILAAVIPGVRKWDTPIDGNRLLGGEPILGPNKTWRGIVTGMVVATFVLWLQQAAAANWEGLRGLLMPLDYDQLPTLLLGPALGFGALGGDAIESFFKRRTKHAAGTSWVPFDQLDYIIGGVIAALPFVVLSLRQYLLVFILWFCIHLAASYVGYQAGLKKQPI